MNKIIALNLAIFTGITCTFSFLLGITLIAWNALYPTLPVVYLGWFLIAISLSGFLITQLTLAICIIFEKMVKING